ncbi:MAG: SGNH/GDSL hydrolase family protein, partial [Candidatus Hinthialibacter sp.]
MMNPWNMVSQRWLLALLVLLLALAAADRWLNRRSDSIRMQGDRKFYHWDARTLWRFRPYLDMEGNGRRMRTNSMGFRGVQEYALSSPHDLRIITLGDSRAYGMTVDDDFTFSHILQNQLRSRGMDAEVINTGTPGYTIAQARGKLEQMLVYKPDIALLCVGYNDRRYLILTPPDSEEMYA